MVLKSRKKRAMGFCLLIPFIILLMTGCSGSRNNQWGISDGAYKKFVEKKQALAAEEQAS